MEIVSDKNTLISLLNKNRSSVRGLIPTMGNLHKGHLDLVYKSTLDCAYTVVTIFVNPLQFGPNEDFHKYPRTIEEDIATLKESNVDLLFAPSVNEMYGEDKEEQVIVAVPRLSEILCGENRPGHFDGVTTVVAKLLNLISPTYAYFGQKDWQQLALVKTMVEQLDMQTKIVGIKTTREKDGLAISSRNQYLTKEERSIAPLLKAELDNISIRLRNGETDYEVVETESKSNLSRVGFDVDYIAIRDSHRLCTPDEETKSLRILAAAYLGRTRLIDNIGF
ncbi:MAG: pantoate--beta-alanine ligase [Pseudomonadales bacterium]|nr:pantoate--beta-alanine ligase [Pseudomonadales bacterium]